MKNKSNLYALVVVVALVVAEKFVKFNLIFKSHQKIVKKILLDVVVAGLVAEIKDGKTLVGVLKILT